MVSELDITNQDVAKIAEMIDAEIAALVPDWKTDHNVTETDSNVNNNNKNAGFCGNCASNEYLQETVSSNSEISRDKSHHHQFDCPDENRNCSSVHGRFEEISYQMEGQEQHGVGGNVVVSGGEGNKAIHYADIWGLRDSRSDEEEESSVSLKQSPRNVKWSENEIRRELRWLKARHRIQLTRARDHQTEIAVTTGVGEKFEIGTSASSPPLLYRAISLPVDALDI